MNDLFVLPRNAFHPNNTKSVDSFMEDAIERAAQELGNGGNFEDASKVVSKILSKAMVTYPNDETGIIRTSFLIVLGGRLATQMAQMRAHGKN